ncbi:DNRLRE domain-containing protein [Reichenbachiella agarivorans]|uniref:DNRLRE domain-containing protein n=1 Tax=Reichenbachiella agarivorans TaxID=2979464 RepID=A0ABY6CVD3_9BACT|nr:DNRLRE domain-containing protein [Reichenbachiella agarivorans]UXP33884.1 DNRLRE domain-containing protein [Reichenbachiella agarivorans]
MKTITMIVMLMASFTFAMSQSGSPYEVVRLNSNQPIITQQMFADLGAATEGENINGPSIIHVPDWIDPANRAHPSAQYYVYFAHHSDDYIRMAWAANIEGPYHLYQTGIGVPVGDRGVLDHGGKFINLDNGISIEDNHLASPDVHVDDVNQRIIMYFHTGSSTFVNGVELNDQVTYVSYSPYGLEFYDNIQPVFLGSSYFRVFEYGGEMYALDNGAKFYQALDPADPWTAPDGWDYTNSLWDKRSDHPFQDDILNIDGLGSDVLRVRHTGVRVVGDELQVFYTRRGEINERVQMSTVDMSAGDWTTWDTSYPPFEIMVSNPGWEGGEHEKLNSETSDAPEDVNQLRDPDIFEDTDGKVYIVYAGEGEDALGIARLYETPVPNQTVVATMDAHVRAGNNADTNYGAEAEMEVKNTPSVTSNLRKVYLKFDLTSVAAIEHAAVKLYTNSTKSLPVTAYVTDNSWNENTITWNTAPVVGEAITTTQVGEANAYYSWNISEYAKSKVGGEISLVIYLPAEDGITLKLSSKEGVNAPQLELVTTTAAVPADPSQLSAYATSDEAIQLSWTDNATHETGYKVERKEGAGAFVEIADLGANVSHYHDTGLPSETTYTYRIIAYNATGNSSYSSEVTASTLETVISFTYAPTDDAYIHGGNSDVNYGTEDLIEIKQGGNVDFFRKGLVKFDLTGEDLGNNIEKATLRLYVLNSASMDLSFYGTQDNWDETTVTWNNGPAEGDLINVISLAGRFVYYEVDVTDYVMDQLGLDSLISIGFWDLAASNATMGVNSKEAAEFHPELILIPGDPLVPADPTALSAHVASDTEIQLSWNDNTNNELGYKIERKEGSGSFVELADLDPNTTQYSDLSLTSSTAYTYRVIAYNMIGNSNYSHEIAATTLTSGASVPVAPTTLSAVVASDTEIALTWTDNASDENGYKIERKEGEGEFTEIANVPADASAYTDSGLTSETTYTYRVIAYNSTGSSNYSNTSSAVTMMSAPIAPSTLSAPIVIDNEIELAWIDHASNEIGYKVERKEGEGEFTEIADLPADASAYTDSGLSSETTYTYRIVAYNSTGSSDYSNELTVTTLAVIVRLSFNPTEDTYIRGGVNADINYGADADLQLKQGANEDFYRKVLVKFDLSGEDLNDITSASLRLYAIKAGPMNLTAYEMDDTWTESMVTWNNAPSDGSYITHIALDAEETYYELDVTDYVAAQLAGDRIVSIGFWDLDASNETIEFNSKEAENNTPELIIVPSVDEEDNDSEGEGEGVVTTIGDTNLHTVSIYPNPLNKSVLTIDMPLSSGMVDIAITDLQGKMIYQNQTQNQGSLQLNTNTWLTKGMYVVTVTSSDFATRSKLIVQ